MDYQIKKILVPTDNSKNSIEAFQYAVNLAEKYQSTMHVLHVVDFGYLDEAHYFETGPYISPADMKEKIIKEGMKETEDFINENTDNKAIKIEKIVKKGKPFVEIIITARELDADLIVMGTHGRTGLSHAFMGSVAEKVVRKAFCPVLTVKSKDFKFKTV